VPKSPNDAKRVEAQAPSLEDLASQSGMPSEHVLLESEEIFEPAGSERSQTVLRRFRLRNWIRRIETVFTLFDDGYLSISERWRGQLKFEHTVDLRHLDPRPVLSRFAAKSALHTTLLLSLVGFSLLLGMLAYFADLPKITALLSLGSVISTVAALWVFLRRKEEQVAFRTKHGHVIVLTMVANFGCFRVCRARARKLVTAINEVHRQNKHGKERLLRAEVREHYRLLQTGVLSDEACTAAVRRILAHFN